MLFTKMQGIGNDYIYVNCMEKTPEHPEKLSVMLSDRHFGVGSDGLVLICPCNDADFRMRMFNADGSESEMCGNAARCVGKYVFERGLTEKRSIRLMTGAGIRTVDLNVTDGKVASVRVDMGQPFLKPEEIPVLTDGEDAQAVPLTISGESMTAVCVSMGNPHAVFFVENADTFPVHVYGPAIEKHPVFPARINAEFATVINRKHLRMRVWERGSGETMACGTGACATLVAGVLTGRCDREITMTLNGGNLRLCWDPETGHVFQEGPAAFVFDGNFILPEEA